MSEENNAFTWWFDHYEQNPLEASLRSAFEAGQAAEHPTPCQEITALRAQLAALQSIDNATNEWRDSARRWRKEAEAARRLPKEEPLRELLNRLLDAGIEDVAVYNEIERAMWGSGEAQTLATITSYPSCCF